MVILRIKIIGMFVKKIKDNDRFDDHFWRIDEDKETIKGICEAKFGDELMQ